MNYGFIIIYRNLFNGQMNLSVFVQKDKIPLLYSKGKGRSCMSSHAGARSSQNENSPHAFPHAGCLVQSYR